MKPRTVITPAVEPAQAAGSADAYAQVGMFAPSGRPAAVTFHSAAALHSMLPSPHVDRHLSTSGGWAHSPNGSSARRG